MDLHLTLIMSNIESFTGHQEIYAFLNSFLSD